MGPSSIVIRSVVGRLLVTGVVAAAVGCTTGAPPPASPVATPAASLPPGFPIGSWSTTITEADLRAGGITEAPAIRENAGTFVRTYAPDGTWTIVQTSTEQLAMPVFRGTWRATGPNEIEETTTFPPEYAGDVVRFTWAREGPNLVLRVPNPPDPFLPIHTESHPWTPR